MLRLAVLCGMLAGVLLTPAHAAFVQIGASSQTQRQGVPTDTDGLATTFSGNQVAPFSRTFAAEFQDNFRDLNTTQALEYDLTNGIVRSSLETDYFADPIGCAERSCVNLPGVRAFNSLYLLASEQFTAGSQGTVSFNVALDGSLFATDGPLLNAVTSATVRLLNLTAQTSSEERIEYRSPANGSGNLLFQPDVMESLVTDIAVQAGDLFVMAFVLESFTETRGVGSTFADFGNTFRLSYQTSRGLSINRTDPDSTFLANANTSVVPVPAAAFLFAPALLCGLGLKRRQHRC